MLELLDGLLKNTDCFPLMRVTVEEKVGVPIVAVVLEDDKLPLFAAVPSNENFIVSTDELVTDVVVTAKPWIKKNITTFLTELPARSVLRIHLAQLFGFVAQCSEELHDCRVTVTVSFDILSPCPAEDGKSFGAGFS